MAPIEQLAFGTCVFERSLPGYFQFQQESNWLGGGDLRAALARCWQAIEAQGGGASLASTNLDRWAPDSEDHESSYVSSAIDAVTIACCLMDYLNTGDSGAIVEAAEARRDTIDLFVQRVLPERLTGIELEERIASHPFMLRELELMAADLAEIDRLARTGGCMSTGLLRRVRELRYNDLSVHF